jgi:hypothetical protein
MGPMRTLIHRLQAFTLTALELAGPDRRSNCEADVAGRPPGACCPWSLIGVTWLSAAVLTACGGSGGGSNWGAPLDCDTELRGLLPFTENSL